MSKIKIGLIGCGKQSLKHIPALKEITDSIIIADQEYELAFARSKEFSLEAAQTVDEIFDNPEIDAVDICTPTPSHCSLIQRAAESHKNFFCEKPLASSYKEALKIERLWAETELVGMVGYLYRFHPAFEIVRDCINEAVIGRPYFATFRLGGRGSHRAWKHKKSEGGGAINEMMVHMLDLVLWYFGSIKNIQPIFCDTILRERTIDGNIIQADAEDLAMVHLETESGVRVVCESDLITPSYMNYVELQGTNGSIITSILDYIPTIIFCKQSRGAYQIGNNVQHFSKVNLFERQLGYFVDCIANGTKHDRNTIGESVYLLNIIDQIKRNIRGDNE